jgi:hypothetical protein
MTGMSFTDAIGHEPRASRCSTRADHEPPRHRRDFVDLRTFGHRAEPGDEPHVRRDGVDQEVARVHPVVRASDLIDHRRDENAKARS